ncbi:Aste57867_8617 [Aphanomyces stellatus]|uniref:Aste57867_8617 protein n=1 Tax=Aphanomyces stellatus TaxID=120398 RepID=A0A485KKQ2_9STRA|nr:hypothetical protein As57867_008583 [Aphanomyces stellatus]VFT85503.1 Aste57867_8617 [Aphanomyces stellatus]
MSLATRLTEFLVRHDVTAAVSVAVFRDGRIHTFESPSPLDKRPVTQHTRFQAASISKPVTAMAVLKLVDQGLLDLDVDVRTYLKDAAWTLPFTNGVDPSSVAITLRHLLSHTAGTTVHGFCGYGIGAPPISTIDILNNVKFDVTVFDDGAVVVDRAPGTYRYSGGGYTVVQLVLESVLHTPFEDIMEQLLLQPLGMTDSSFHIDSSKGDHLAYAAPSNPNETFMVEENLLKGLGGEYCVYPQGAAAGLWTTATDLAKLNIAILTSLNGSPGAFWSRKSAALLLQSVSVHGPGSDDNGSIGLGWFLSDDKLGDLSVLTHTGGNVGFRSSSVTFTKRNAGFVVLQSSSFKYNFDSDDDQAVAVRRAIGREFDAILKDACANLDALP